MSNNLNPQKALIFRIVHRENIPWILEHGLHCRSSKKFDPHYKTIGSVELIERRTHREVPIPPGGKLSDYIPFYFTPYSIMMYNIKTGHGVARVPNEEIVICVSSLRLLTERKRPFVFTDRHAYLANAEYSSNLDDLDRIDWEILRNKDFRNDENDLGKKERYQAEALIHQHLAIDDLQGIVCYDQEIAGELKKKIEIRKLSLRLEVKPTWYF